MFRRLPRLALALAVLLTSTALPAQSGQVRINVASNSFSPAIASVNLGDHVVWVWTGGSHTVTSGTNNGSTGTANNRFSAGTEISPLSGATYSWKSNVVRSEPYFCFPHIAFGMEGTINVLASGASASSDFRITEVLFAGGEDRVEIANLGATGDLAKYRLKIAGQALGTLQIGINNNNIAVPAGGRVVLHFGTSGTNTATDLFFPALSLPDASGSVALYAPNTAAPSLADATQIIDFVQWGASGQENEATANTAGQWASGSSITGVAPGHSIEFCGTPGQRGIAFWSEVAVPNFGLNGGCATPTVRSTWGRVKSLYR